VLETMHYYRKLKKLWLHSRQLRSFSTRSYNKQFTPIIIKQID